MPEANHRALLATGSTSICISRIVCRGGLYRRPISRERLRPCRRDVLRKAVAARESRRVVHDNARQRRKSSFGAQLSAQAAANGGTWQAHRYASLPIRLRAQCGSICRMMPSAYPTYALGAGGACIVPAQTRSQDPCLFFYSISQFSFQGHFFRLRW